MGPPARGLSTDSGTNGLGQDGGWSSDGTDWHGGGIWINDASPTITGNVITANNSTLGGGIYSYGSRAAPTVTHNVFLANTATSQGGAMMLFENDGAVVNNIFDSNVAYAAGALEIASSGDLQLINNTFVFNEATGESYNGAHIELNSDGDEVIENNIFAYGVGAAAIGASSNAHVANCNYNDFYDNDDGAVSNTTACTAGSNTASDPVFTSRSTGDYTLQSSSGCIDAGDPDSVYNDTDGSRNDLGAFGGLDGACYRERSPVTGCISRSI